MRPRRLGLKAAALLIAWTAGVFALGARGALKARSAATGDLGSLPDFALTGVDPSGERPVGRADLLGRPWVADFVFTRCSGPCPVLTATMAELQRELPEGVRLVTFTVDPDYDSAEVLRRYARGWGARPGRWLFLTGTKADIYRLVYEGFKLAVAEDRAARPGERVIHSTRFALVGSDGKLRGLYGKESLPELKAVARRLVEGKDG